MEVSYYNYRRMNEFLRPELQEKLDMLLSMDTDSELYRYQYKNEKSIGKALGKGYAVGLSCGTAALQFSLISLGIGKDDEVITVPSYIATLLSISDTDARPVLVDIEEDTMLIDTKKIEEKINNKTKAIMPVHLYGQMADMDRISKIAKKHNLHVVEDAAQSHIARFNGKLPGSKSDSACYSFFLNKNLGGISNGGMIITKNKKIYNDSRILRNPSSNGLLTLKSKRTPAYLDWMQIAFLTCKIKYVKGWTERKRQIAKMYYGGLSGLPIKLPVEDKRTYHVYRDFVIRTKKRDRLHRYLKRKKIQTIVHYPESYHLSRTYAHLGYKKGDFPISEESSSKVLSLPINPFVSDDEIGYVINHIRKFFK